MQPTLFDVLFGIIKTAAIITAVFLIPIVWRLVRFIYKRISLYFRLTSGCRRIGAEFIPRRRFWMFAGKRGSECDFYIETETAVYSVKLWETMRYHTELHFTSEGEYYTRSFIAFASRIGMLFRTPVDSMKKRVPAYEMRPDFKYEWYMKRFVPVLLISPVCHEICYVAERGIKRYIGAGDMVNDLYIYSTSRLLGELENTK